MLYLPPPSLQPWPEEWIAKPKSSSSMNISDHLTMHWMIEADGKEMGHGFTTFSINPAHKKPNTNLSV